MNTGSKEGILSEIVRNELKEPAEEILRYVKKIAAESDDASIRGYAEKIESCAAGLSDRISSLAEAAPGYACEAAVPANIGETGKESERPLVLIVDDDEMICGTASDILGSVFRTASAYSGAEALASLASVKPSLILMDINMPEMDGFETLDRIRRLPGVSPIPVIFLTGDEDRDVEVRCLKAGAADFVRKPPAAQVLIERVRRLIELDRLQNALSSEVAVQTRRSAHLSNEIMLALSKAVDAKDHYTNGHSRRVAEYSAEIARRMGKSRREQEDIYAMGLLHDVGKIGVSEAIINKPSRLDDDEYAQIKMHTTIGYDILKIITEIPGLATGARWHHERYDGRGYPDGLSGDDIPEEARIICVADSYDAMTSNRSYSNIREQAAVRDEIIRCRGSQFDPRIADIMVSMIDDDPEYMMSESIDHNASVPGIPHDIAAARFVDEAPGTLSASKPEGAGADPAFIPEVSGMELSEARKNIPDENMLAATVKRFADLMPSKLGKLEAAYDKLRAGGDADEYRINVHSMKSSAAAAGFTALSDLSRRLEMLASKGDIGGIHALHEKLVSEWSLAAGRLSDAYSERTAAAAKKGGGEKALPELLTMLKLYMESMDVDAADGVMKLIRAYSYTPAVEGLLEELDTAVAELDEDAAVRIADSIDKEIENEKNTADR